MSLSYQAYQMDVDNGDRCPQMELDKQNELKKQAKIDEQVRLQNVEFEAWGSANGVDPFSAQVGDHNAFLAQKRFSTWEDLDPPEHPRLNAFATFMDLTQYGA
jgi:hypothetical protein